MLVVDILRILIQFVFRVTFGMSLAMGATSPLLVTSGYFQKHLWVLMALNTVAALAVYSSRSLGAAWATPAAMWLAAVLGFACYVGSVLWLYECRRLGRWLLIAVAVVGLVAGVLATAPPGERSTDGLPPAVGASWWRLVATVDVATGGLVLGATLAAMFLGHWYLNTPTMELRPLRRLLVVLLAAVVVRGMFAAVSTGLRVFSAEQAMATEFWLFLSLRWLAGIVGVFGMGWMAWETLRIPNTQSATGVLYAGVILAFIGELTAQLLSAGRLFPV